MGVWKKDLSRIALPPHCASVVTLSNRKREILLFYLHRALRNFIYRTSTLRPSNASMAKKGAHEKFPSASPLIGSKAQAAKENFNKRLVLDGPSGMRDLW